LFVFIFFQSCASRELPKRPVDLPFSHVFTGDFDTVWNATVQVLEQYSITVAVRSSGLIQTDWMNSRHNTDLFDYPHKQTFLEEVKSKIKVKLSKGYSSKSGRSAVRVQISKVLREYKNIIYDWQRIPTDFYEEQVLLYRIGRKIKILKAIKREKKRLERKQKKKQSA